MEQSVVVGWLFKRGVWRAPYLVEGFPTLIAVDAFGVVRKHLKLKPGVNPEAAADWLHDFLDHVDPPRQLALVKSAPPLADVRTPEDPRSSQARQQYIRSLAKNAAARIPRRPPAI